MRWRQWLVTIFIMLVGLFVIAYGLGERVPVEHTSVAAVTISAPQAKVWGLITNVPAQPTWRRGLKSIEMLPPQDGHPRWTEHYSGASMTFILEKSDPMASQVVNIDPKGAQMDGGWTYSLLPMDDGRTSVTITEHANLYSPLYRFVSQYILGYTFNQKRYLDDLQKTAQS